MMLNSRTGTGGLPDFLNCDMPLRSGIRAGDWNLQDWKMTDCTNTASHYAAWNISC